jgi:hypothetical protein
MRRTICRLALAASVALALSALTLTPAEAASPAVGTGSAIYVSAGSATLTGFLYTGGQPTYYEFRYGPTTGYGAQTTLRSVAAGVSATQSVSELVSGLKPFTTYHFELVAATSVGGYYGTPLFGGDRTFTTSQAANIGSLRLASRKLIVDKRGVVKISLMCASSLACNGSIRIKHGSVSCVRGKRFSIPAGGRKTVKASVTGACRRLLRRARRHRSRGKLAASLSSGQPSLSGGVTLIRR